MDQYTENELEEALRAITSTLRKSEKSLGKLQAGTGQHTTLERGNKAYTIAIDLIKSESESGFPQGAYKIQYAREELEEARQSIISLASRVEKALPKFEEGTPQHTLAVRRIKAFDIAVDLIERELSHSL